MTFVTNAVARASLDTAGDFSAVTLTETSDERVKNNIEDADIEDSLNKINEIKPSKH